MMIRRFFLVFFMFLSLTLNFTVLGQGGSGGDYAATIAKADEYFKKGDYINAKSSYQYASRLKPEEQYPKDRLRETIDKLRQKMARMEEYTAVLTEADNLYRKKEYDQAIAKYREAGKIIPSEGYPEEKIKEIEGAKDEARKQQIAYDDAIYRADKYVKYRKYEEAIEAYRSAAEIMPGEPYPAEQIKALESELEALVEARNAYESIIANADRLYSLKYYENARAEFQKAADARPEDDYPKSMIAKIDNLLVKKTEFDKHVEAGDSKYMSKNLEGAKQSYQQALTIYPSESYPKDMIEKINAALMDQVSADDLYASAISAADQFLASDDYANALQEYGIAKDLKPDEPYPTRKIDEINTILKAKEEGEQEYALAIKLGDQYLNAGAHAEAKTEFEKALAIKPGEDYPTERLSIAVAALNDEADLMASYKQSMDKGDAFMQQKEYEKAIAAYKDALVLIPGDNLADEKIDEAQKLMGQQQQSALLYSQYIKEADQFMASNDLMAARDNYQLALDTDPQATYPQEKINLINQTLEDQRSVNAAYNKAIATADIYFNNKEYNRAKAEYEKASELKPNENYPKDKLGEISAAMVVLAPQGDEYTETLKEADGLMGLQEYDKARLLYLKAANMRPKEQYPKDKIEEIDSIVSRQESEQAEYNRLVSAADRMLESGDYDMARERYSQALEVMPAEQYPREKLAEIDQLILKQELDVQEAYNAIIEEADQLFAQQAYDGARIKYQNALKYKPGEAYPLNKLDEIDALSSDLKRQQDQYNKLIVEADNAFTGRNYQVAKTKYAAASQLFPEEEHPRVRLEEINVIIRSSNQNAMQAYEKTVADADKFFSAGAYGQALGSYRTANAMMPDEAYPQEMIDKIMKILNDNAFRKLLTSSKSIQNNEVEKFSFDPISVADRKSSILVIRVRGMGIRDFKVFVSYGKGGSKNGGFIMPMPAGDDMKEYLFELGNQYTWFSEDNNWISLTPQGGSIEVTLVEIAKAAAE